MSDPVAQGSVATTVNVVLYTGDPATVGSTFAADASKRQEKQRVGTVTWLPAGLLVTYAPLPQYDEIRVSLGVLAAFILGIAAFEMFTVVSVPGYSAAESFYRALGIGLAGLAMLAVTVGLRKQ